MSPLSTWIVLAGILFVGICIALLAVAWLLAAYVIGGEVYDDAPKYDDEADDDE